MCSTGYVLDLHSTGGIARVIMVITYDFTQRQLDHRTNREKRLGNQHGLHTSWNHESLACIERVIILDKYPGVCQRQKLHIS